MCINILNLPDDKKRIIDALLDKVESKYKNDIAIVVCYGSYISGTAHPKSDIDFFFIPKTEKGYEINLQFIIDDIGYDFWSLSWERAEQIANFEEPVTSIIADGVIIYYCDSDDLKRFSLLRHRIKDITAKPENKEFLVNKAEELLAKAKIIFFDMIYISNDYEIVDSNCSKILGLLFNIISLLNLTYIKKGVYNIEDEIKAYSVLPEKFLDLFNSAVRSSNITDKIDFVKKLMISVDMLVQKKKYKKETKISNNSFKGFYEELKSTYNKLIHACNSKDYLKVFFTVHSIDFATKNILGEKYKDFNFPNLIVQLGSNDYDKLIESTYQHEKALVNILKTYKIDVIKYENINQFIESL